MLKTDLLQTSREIRETPNTEDELIVNGCKNKIMTFKCSVEYNRKKNRIDKKYLPRQMSKELRILSHKLISPNSGSPFATNEHHR